MKRLYVAIALFGAVVMLSLGTSTLAKNGRLGGLYRAAENHHFAPVPKTGQTDSFYAGDDGVFQKGISWPEPRFTDNGNGTVTDNLTGLVWTRNASIFGYPPNLNWHEACEACNQLADGFGGLSDESVAGDWRLPNLRELHSLVHYGFFNPALPNTLGTGKWSQENPFTEVNPSVYWTSTSLAYNPDIAWTVDFWHGEVVHSWKTDILNRFVWCVRGGIEKP